MNDPGPRVVTDAAIAAPAVRRCPQVARRPDDRGDLHKQLRRSQQPDVDVFFFVARPETETSERVQPVKLARTIEEERRYDEHCVVTNHPDANRSDVFVLRPYNRLR